MVVAVTLKERQEMEAENLRNVARMRNLMLDSRLDKLYREFWEVAKERLERLNLQTGFLENIKNPASLGILVSLNPTKATAETNAEMQKVEEELNKIFAKANNLPEKVEDSMEMKHFLNDYIRKKTGKEFKVEIKKYKDANCVYYPNSNCIGFREGISIIEVPSGVLHELEHSREPWGRLITSNSKRSRRASWRYGEGRAVFAEMRLAMDSDDAVAAYSAIDMMRHIAEPNPQFYFNEKKRKDKLTMRFARASEGFRMYYLLLNSVGEENLRKFEEACAATGLVPGMLKDGSLVVIKPESSEMFKIDVERLAAGDSRMERLMGERVEEEKRKGLERLKFWKRLD